MSDYYMNAVDFVLEFMTDGNRDTFYSEWFKRKKKACEKNGRLYDPGMNTYINNEYHMPLPKGLGVVDVRTDSSGRFEVRLTDGYSEGNTKKSIRTTVHNLQRNEKVMAGIRVRTNGLKR